MTPSRSFSHCRNKDLACPCLPARAGCDRRADGRRSRWPSPRATARYPNSHLPSVTRTSTATSTSSGQVLIWLGIVVFIFVEGILLYAIFKFRRRSESDRPEHVHGNTTLEILWTVDPGGDPGRSSPSRPCRRSSRRRRRRRPTRCRSRSSATSGGGSSAIRSTTITTANELYLPDRPHGELRAQDRRT